VPRYPLNEKPKENPTKHPEHLIEPLGLVAGQIHIYVLGLRAFDTKAVEDVVHSPLHAKGEIGTAIEYQGLITTRLLNLVKGGENLASANLVRIVDVNVVGRN
jgi:hypothetical protein